MPTDIILTGETLTEPERKRLALERLRQEANPFDSSVVRASNIEQSLDDGVPEYTSSQVADLLEVIGKYRDHKQATQVIPVVGDVGTGKTQLLHTFKVHLKELSKNGDQTLFVVVPRLTEGIEPLSFLLSEITNHLLEKNNEGEQLLKIIAAKITGRTLSQALLSLPEAKRADLIPIEGFWNQLGNRLGGQKSVIDRIERFNRIIHVCDDPDLSPDEIRKVCETQKFDLKAALELIQKHLSTTEGKTDSGKVRQKFYSALAEMVLFQNYEPIESFLASDEDISVKGGFGYRRLLKCCLETLHEFHIPVCIVFDQLEDYFVQNDPTLLRVRTAYFASTLTSFVNELHNVCLLVFSEESRWIQFVNGLEEQMRMRLQQPISLRGKPTQYRIQMPTQVSESVILQMIRNGVRRVAPELVDWELPVGFPFDAKDVASFQKEATIRFVMRKLVSRYNEIVYTKPPEPPNLAAILEQIWKKTTEAAAKKVNKNLEFKISDIPSFQNALHLWLSTIEARKLAGTESWRSVELYTKSDRGNYGYLNLIRVNGRGSAGLGIAFWLGRVGVQLTDLKNRLDFFNDKPCPIIKLVLLRADGLAAVSKGKSKELFDEVVDNGRDVRIEQYDAKTLHQIVAFDEFFRQASTEFENCKDLLPKAEQIMDQFLVEISQPILNWVAAWQKPVPDKQGLFS